MHPKLKNFMSITQAIWTKARSHAPRVWSSGLKARPSGHIDRSIFLFGYILVFSWVNEDSPVVELILEINGRKKHFKTPRFVRYQRDDAAQHLVNSNIPLKAPKSLGLILLISPNELGVPLAELKAKPFNLSIVFGSGHILTGNNALTVGLTQLLECQFTMIPSSVLSELVSPSNETERVLCQVVLAINKPNFVDGLIEQIFNFGEHGCLFNGWIPNSYERDLFFTDQSLSHLTRISSFHVKHRADVETYLRENGREKGSEWHGIAGAFDSDIASREVSIVAAGSGEQINITRYKNIPAKIATKSELLDILKNVSADKLPTEDEASILLNALEALPVDNPEIWRDEWFNRSEDGKSVQLSIVIPFYGDSFFLLDHINSQQWQNLDAEYIIVCDDFRIASAMQRELANRSTTLTRPTRLVILKRNIGFAGASNIGASLASGKYILMMNSDVYCDDFEPIAVAIEQMEKKPNIGCVGFTLSFEDDTIQHQGMRFERSPDLRNLWTSLHPNKGLPAEYDGISIQNVHSVTAALMLLRADDFVDQDIFDQGFLIGDYEDGDLCFRLRDAGKSIILVRASGMYHLERQSFRTLGDSRGRLALTYLNCLRLNRRWAHKLNSDSLSI